MIIVLVMLLFTMNVKALKRNSSELINRSVCSKFELAKALNDTNKNLEKVACYDTYKLAKENMDKSDDKSLVILERSNNKTMIIDAKYALVNLDKGKSELSYVYSNNACTSNDVYMNNYNAYGAVDAAFLEFNESYHSIKLMLDGLTGWVKKGEYNIIPINWVVSSSYYKFTDSITHYYIKDIEANNSLSSRALGKNDLLENNKDKKYYSYDGIYFYEDYYTMIDDYRVSSHEKSVNKDKAYYNYYMYLPHRSKTTYTIDDFDSYIRDVLNFKGSIYGQLDKTYYSNLYSASEYFLYNEKVYGANALSVFSLSRNESANGTSKIAREKNNMFGHTAYDSSAYVSSANYMDIRTGIYTHGNNYINYGYAEVADSRYYGSHFGNKYRGMNVMYASDPYWGEKAASYYYQFDRDNGLNDYNYYQLILSIDANFYGYVSPSTKSNKVYTINNKKYTITQKGLPFILLEEIEGEEINGNKIWYKIQSDSNINNEGNLISYNSGNSPYNWNGVIYVHSSHFIKINEVEATDGKYHSPAAVNKELNNSELKTYADKSSYHPIVGLLKNNTDYYYSSTLLDKKGTFVKNSYVVILEEIMEGDNKKYLVINDYSLYQRAWIDSENVEIVDKDVVGYKSSTVGDYINVLDSTLKNSLLKVYSNNFLVITDKLEKDGKLYLKVAYQNATTINYGYIDSTLKNITYTLNYLNVLPVIKASDQSIMLNETFDPLKGVSASDVEDGDLTKNIKVIENKVNTNKEGTYTVKYQVTDSYGDTVTKEIKVTVYGLKESNSLFMFNSLVHQKDNEFLVSGFMGIRLMDNIDVSSEMLFVNELTKKEYTFKLDKWTDYPYEMSSLDDTRTYNNTGGWFKSILDLSTLPLGDYTVYVHVINGKYEAKTLFTNVGYAEMTRRAKGNNREYAIEVDFSTLNSPLVFSVREKLLSLDVPATYDPMYNFFNTISLQDNSLSIKGTSHTFGVGYKASDDVVRTMVFENQETYEMVEMDLGSITDGDYTITLAVSDNMDKTRAWFNKTIDLSSLKPGKYTIYLKNTVNNQTFYGELIDAAYTDFTKINNSKYIFSGNYDVRLRLELEVK